LTAGRIYTFTEFFEPTEEPMSNCGCEGSCPVCRVGEVDDHKCADCGAEFCPKCHGTKGKITSDSVMPCKCKRRKVEDKMPHMPMTL